MRIIKFVFVPTVLSFVFVMIIGSSFASDVNGIVVDHTMTDLGQVPEQYIEQAKSTYKILYGHTSHGSQIISGMENLSGGVGSMYYFNSDGGNDGLMIKEISGDLGSNGDTTWASTTQSELDKTDNEINMVMWSWCGGVSTNTAEGISTYLETMNQLEQEYPDVIFVYMTGHLDGSGEDGNLNKMNDLIRDYAKENNKVLFDFADIESYDPDGNYYLDEGANDNNDYASGNWATSWCSDNSGDDRCEACSCAHSQSLNCNLKGRAFWSMMAYLAGWNNDSFVADESGDDVEVVASASGPFPDVSADYWAAKYIQNLSDHGVVSGKEDGKFYPEAYISRAEFLKMIVEGLYGDLEAFEITEPSFADVSPEDWFYNYAVIAREEGIISGYEDNTLRPGKNITRAEAVAILIRALGVVTEEAPSIAFIDVQEDWQKGCIKAAFTLGIVSGYDGTHFGPNDLLTRAQAAKIVSESIESL